MSHGDEAKIFYLSCLFDEIDWKDRSPRDNQKVTHSPLFSSCSSPFNPTHPNPLHSGRRSDSQSSRRNFTNFKISQLRDGFMPRLRRRQSTKTLPDAPRAPRGVWIGECLGAFEPQPRRISGARVYFDAFAEQISGQSCDNLFQGQVA